MKTLGSCGIRYFVSALMLILTQYAGAVEFALRDDPIGIRDLRPVKESTGKAEEQEEPVILVDWGRVAESQTKDPREGQRELAAIKDFLNSPELRDMLKERGIVQAQMAMIMQDLYWQRERQFHDTRSVATRFPTMFGQSVETIPKTPITNRMPWQYRKDIRLIFLDGRDKRQIHWLGEWWATERSKVPKETMVFFLAMTNRVELQKAMDTYPAIPFELADDFQAEEHMIQALPAVVHFPNDQEISIVQGITEKELKRQKDAGLITAAEKPPEHVVYPGKLPPRPTVRMVQPKGP